MFVTPLLPTLFYLLVVERIQYSEYLEILQRMAKDKKVRRSVYLESHPIYESGFCIPCSWFLPSAQSSSEITLFIYISQTRCYSYKNTIYSKLLCILEHSSLVCEWIS